MDTNKKATTLEELIETKEYKKSKYELLETRGGYCLQNRKSERCLDLHGDYGEMGAISNIRAYCIGTEIQILNSFYENLKIVKKSIPLVTTKFKSKKENKELEINNYRAKLMEGLE